MSYRLTVDGTFTLDRPLTVEHKVTLEKYAKERHDSATYPWCQWVPTEDGTGIQYTEDEISGYNVDEWLTTLIDRFLKPWGYVLNGRADYFSEEQPDIGAIFVKDNEVRSVEAEIIIRDPFKESANIQ